MPNQTIKAAMPDASVCFMHGSVESRPSGSIGTGSSSYGPSGFRSIGITSAGCSRLERSAPHLMHDRSGSPRTDGERYVSPAPRLKRPQARCVRWVAS
jgi:hypothetical protein